MKVVVLGGYGVFGARLVRLLVRDGHAVVVAGRSAGKAGALAAQVGATALRVDRGGDLSALWALAPDVVVDAAGPFHAYGDDPYALPRACVDHGVNYLDLADDPAFCAGITVLDQAACGAGVFVLSGVSSVPAISSAVVAALAEGAARIDTINTAILPGNRAPRGRAVIESILHQCGKPFDVMVDGASVPVRSWSRPDRFDLGQGIVRKGWMIEVPDHRLFPKAFGARTVLFRAGMELGVMNHTLAAISWLRGRLGFGVPGWFVTMVLWIAKLLWPFGTDEGGMSVAVTARWPDGWRRKTWRLVARQGEGPFIPAIAARVILRDPGAIAAGARPAVAVVPLAAIEAGMDDLAVVTEVLEQELTPLFPGFLGADFEDLPQPVQQAHLVYGPRRWAGRARVTRGQSLWARVLAALFGFPGATDDTPVTVQMTPTYQGETWERQFGEKRFRSHLCLHHGQMTEQFGPVTFTLDLHVADGQLHFPVTAGRFGPLPLPVFLLPQSVAREYEMDGRFHFDVMLKAPLTGGLMVHYQGWLKGCTKT
jgi:NAD(P)-dependent dehydrogenase (short-subunit alcohol dehydrogenase family)